MTGRSEEDLKHVVDDIEASGGKASCASALSNVDASYLLRFRRGRGRG